MVQWCLFIVSNDVIGYSCLVVLLLHPKSIFTRGSFSSILSLVFPSCVNLSHKFDHLVISLTDKVLVICTRSFKFFFFKLKNIFLSDYAYENS